MENQKSETDKLLEFQASKLTAIEQTKTLLLGDGSEYNHIKKIYGFNDTDNVILESQGKVIELQERIKEENDNNIVDEEYIINYCLDNGYILTKLENYKGKVTTPMLKAINDYINANTTARTHNTIYILMSINDVNGNNKSIKKSKRLSPQDPNKLIIVDKLINGNRYNHQHYRIIHEEGKLRSIYNWFTSLFRVSTQQEDTLSVTSIIFGIIYLIWFTLCVTGDYTVYKSNFYVMFNVISIFILISNIVYHILADNDRHISLFSSGYWYRHRDSTILYYLGTSIKNTNGDFLECFEGKIRKKFFIGRLILSIGFYALFTISYESIRAIKMNIHDNIINEVITEDKYQKTITYEKNGIFNYTITEKIKKIK